MRAHLLKLRHTALALFLAAPTFAQPDPRPKFDVTSVKPHPAGTRMGLQIHPGSVSMLGITIPECMLLAYKLQRFQITGGPSWVDGERFDIAGEFDAADHTAAVTPDQRQPQPHRSP